MKQIKWLFSVLVVMVACTSLFAQDAKRAYLGVRLGAGVGLTRPLGEFEVLLDVPGSEWSKGGASFDFAPFVSLQIVDGFALQTEMLVTEWGGEYNLSDDFGVLDGGLKIGFSRNALIIPLLAKFTFRPNNFVIQAFLGPHLTANIGKWNTTYAMFGVEEKEELDDKEMAAFLDGDRINYPPIGITGGIGFGVKAGPGNIFVDARFITDAGVISKDAQYIWSHTGERVTREEYLFYRAKLSFTVGYEFGLGSR
jgi:hypothetical protein